MRTNDAPVASDRDLVADEDAPAAVTIPATDPDGDPLTFTVEGAPAHGRVEQPGAGGPDRAYVPDPDYSGPDSFTFKANDGRLDSNVATVHVTVREANDPPVANPDSKSMVNLGLSLDPASLPSAQRWALYPGSLAEDQSVSLVPGSVHFDTLGHPNGFAYYTRHAVFPTAGYEIRARVRVTSVEEPSQLNFCIGAEERGFAHNLYIEPDRMAVHQSPGTAEVFPGLDNTDFHEYSLRVTPGSGIEVRRDGVLFGTVAESPHPVSPGLVFGDCSSAAGVVADVASFEYVPSTSVLRFPSSDLAANDTPGPADETAQHLDVTKVDPGPSTRGDVELAAGTVRYSPEPGFAGDAVFGYTVCDDGTTAGTPDQRCADGTVTVTVRGDPRPVASPLDVTTDEDAPVPIRLPAIDPDGDPLTYTVISGPTHGGIEPAGPGAAERTYTPDPNFNGSDSLTFKASDGENDSNVAPVRFTVREVNDPPTAAPDAKSAEEGTPISFDSVELTANDSAGPPNEAGQTLTVIGVPPLPGPPETQGEVTLEDGTVRYTPKPGFTGTDSFGYKACDDGTTAGSPDSRCADGIVTVDVVAADHAALVALDIAPRGTVLDPTRTQQFQAQASYADGAMADVTTEGDVVDRRRRRWRRSPRRGWRRRSRTELRASRRRWTASSAPLGCRWEVQRSRRSSFRRTIAHLVAGQEQAFVARGIHDDDTSEALHAGDVTWSTSDAAVATISPEGLATTHSFGEVTVTASRGAATGSATLRVKAMAPSGERPTVAISAPGEGSTVTAPIEVTGTANDPELVKYVLELAPAGDTVFTTIVESATPVTDGKLGILDPTLLVNDLYTLRLAAVDAAGNRSETEVTVQVDREQKVGNFTLGFDDLTIPMPGLDVTVTRTYDSRDKTVGDFGVGWRLGVRSARVRTNRVQGRGWHVEKRPAGFGLSNYHLVPDGDHKVSVTLPDGQVEEFDISVSPNVSPVNPFAEAQDLTVSYVARSGTVGTLGVVGDTTVVLGDSSQPGPPNSATLYDDDLGPFDPRVFDYTSPDGTKIRIGRATGVEQVADRNGNVLTITPGGISHSAGLALTFERDPAGRITRMVDPSLHEVLYGYDVDGDLVSHVDASGNVTRFSYDRRHNLLEIHDPLGRRPVRSDYDEDGRLRTVTDANGKVVDFSHNLGTNTETLTDRRGNPTVLEYDGDGNVVTETAFVAGRPPLVTRRGYDPLGNELSTTDPNGNETKRGFDGHGNQTSETTPMGNQTEFTYGSFDQLKSTRDPGGHVTENDIDPANGNVLSTTACSAVTRFSYDGRGNVLEVTDALNGTTVNEYDDRGNVEATTDATGARTEYLYDGNNNRIESKVVRSKPLPSVEIVTRYEYDSQNRLVSTINPDTTSTRTVYDDAGRVVATIDEKNRVTRSVYNARGELERTIYPDRTSTANEYDNNGNVVGAVDQGSRTTSTEYDEVNRPVTVVNPGGSRRTTEYDDGGRVVAEVDERGNRTENDYDPDGRVMAIRRPLGNATSYEYDADALKIAEVDPLGHRTGFDYDCAHRLETTTHPATTRNPVTTRRTGYDLLGRRMSETDQAGVVTGFGFDQVGRLTSVTDALNQVTSYAYDEVGNRISQTDANGHTTSFEYDLRGRQTRKTLPLTDKFETFTHDDTGNVETHTDFNGRTTTFSHDEMNRLLAKVPDPAFSQPTVSFTYSATGQRQTMVDATGTTTYGYDLRDRLETKATPFGTLSYSYEPTGEVASLRSSNAGGASIAYEHDELNRLRGLTDERLASGVTSYGYDLASNLKSVAYPNGVTSSYAYDELNRLTDLTVGSGATTLASYAYELGHAGNRLAVSEADGRRVEYGYDQLYRLRTETVTGDPAGVNGVVGYDYDPVGNRLARTSTLPGVPTTTYEYDENDRITTEKYDDNGNTLETDEHTYTYDYDNRLIGADGGAVTIAYDGDGNKVEETSGGVTTQFLVDDRNPTGYSQVIDELVGGTVTRSYTYGLDLISQRFADGEVSFYGYDGHGSVRLLTNSAGAISDRYSYDVYGHDVASAGATPNRYLYSGEEALRTAPSAYYLRARYYDSYTGRFRTMDSHEGIPSNPATLHQYSYGQNNPATFADPSGNFAVLSVAMSAAYDAVLRARNYVRSVFLYERIKDRLIFATNVGELLRGILYPERSPLGLGFEFSFKFRDPKDLRFRPTVTAGCKKAAQSPRVCDQVYLAFRPEAGSQSKYRIVYDLVAKQFTTIDIGGGQFTISRGKLKLSLAIGYSLIEEQISLKVSFGGELSVLPPSWQAKLAANATIAEYKIPRDFEETLSAFESI